MQGELWLWCSSYEAVYHVIATGEREVRRRDWLREVGCVARGCGRSSHGAGVATAAAVQCDKV